jgi:hypothetical protein
MNNATTRVNQPVELLSIKLSEEGIRTVYEAFPASAIHYVDENFDSASGNSSPWYEFKEQCIAYCRTNNLSINFTALKGKTPSQMLLRVHRQTYGNTGSVSSHSSRRNTTQQGGREGPTSLDQNLANSARRFQTVTRPFFGIPTPAPEHEKELGNGNVYPSVDSGFSSDYCMKELNTFALVREEVRLNDPHHKTFGIGNTLAYLDRVIANWATQYVFSLEREKR